MAQSRASAFVRALASGDPPQVNVAVVVAHPDDETIGCGALLTRLRNVHAVLVTDGAPRSRHAPALAARRAREWNGALAHAGVAPYRRHQLGIVDQTAAYGIAGLTQLLARLFAATRSEVVITHSYEGGHPDHDATACAVHRACRLRREEGHEVAIVEMPFYREAQGELVRQSFVPVAGLPDVLLELEPGARRAKHRMRDAHASQARVLAEFNLEIERFRAAPDYDFRVPANGGRLLYDRYDWGLDGSRWQRMAWALEAPAAAGWRRC